MECGQLQRIHVDEGPTGTSAGKMISASLYAVGQSRRSIQSRHSLRGMRAYRNGARGTIFHVYRVQHLFVGSCQGLALFGGQSPSHIYSVNGLIDDEESCRAFKVSARFLSRVCGIGMTRLESVLNKLLIGFPAEFFE